MTPHEALVDVAPVSTNATKWRKKPVVVEAFQMTRERRLDNRDWPAWLNVAWNKSRREEGALTIDEDDPELERLLIVTKEGTLSVTWGDWIIRGIQGELYPCKPDIFAATYEPAHDVAPVSGGTTDAGSEGGGPLETSARDVREHFNDVANGREEAGATTEGGAAARLVAQPGVNELLARGAKARLAQEGVGSNPASAPSRTGEVTTAMDRVELLISEHDGRTLAVAVDRIRHGPDRGPWRILTSWPLDDRVVEEVAMRAAREVRDAIFAGTPVWAVGQRDWIAMHFDDAHLAAIVREALEKP